MRFFYWCHFVQISTVNRFNLVFSGTKTILLCLLAVCIPCQTQLRSFRPEYSRVPCIWCSAKIARVLGEFAIRKIKSAEMARSLGKAKHGIYKVCQNTSKGKFLLNNQPNCASFRISLDNQIRVPSKSCQPSYPTYFFASILYMLGQEFFAVFSWGAAGSLWNTV